jgi:hypothetical protein
MMKQQHIDIIRKRLDIDDWVPDREIVKEFEGGLTHDLAMVEGFIVNVCVRVGGFIVRWTR